MFYRFLRLFSHLIRYSVRSIHLQYCTYQKQYDPVVVNNLNVCEIAVNAVDNKGLYEMVNMFNHEYSRQDKAYPGN